MNHRFEHCTEPLLTTQAFILRVMVSFSFSFGMGIVIFSLAVGMAGYHFFEHLSWLDSFANASMLLSGMRYLEQPQTDIGKIFAGVYALYSGLAVILITGITFAPIVHRFLHKFHLESEE